MLFHKSEAEIKSVRSIEAYWQPMKCIYVQSRIPSRDLYQAKMVSSVPSIEQKKILIREISVNVIIGTFEHNLRKVTASSHKR